MSQFYQAPADPLPSSRIKASHINRISDAVSSAFQRVEENVASVSSLSVVAGAGCTILTPATVLLRRFPGRLVHARFSVSITSESGTLPVIATLPEGFRPASYYKFNAAYQPTSQSGYYQMVDSYIDTDGNVQLLNKLTNTNLGPPPAGFFSFVGVATVDVLFNAAAT